MSNELTDYNDSPISGAYKHYLIGKVLSSRPEAEQLLDSIRTSVAELSPSLWLIMSSSSNSERKENYLVQYVLPIAEIVGWPSYKDSKMLVDGLSLQFCWQVCWRYLDNLLDSKSRDDHEVESVIAMLYDTCTLHSRILHSYSISDSGIAKTALVETCRLVSLERTGKLGVAEIWRRARLLEIVPINFFQISSCQLEPFRRYITADGLAHDVHDLIDDVSKGFITTPISWLNSLNADNAFRADIMKKWFAIASEQVLDSVFAAEDVLSDRHRILQLLLNEIREIGISLSDFAR
jgi:hypothetical protein